MKKDFTIKHLGKATIKSPLKLSNTAGEYIASYVSDNQYIINDLVVTSHKLNYTYKVSDLIQRAGPREKIYFDPAKVNAAIVTCGGLCPGLNDVVRSIVMCLWYQYGVRRITGIRYGYKGLLPEYNIPTMELNPEAVSGIHRLGGTILGSSRGEGDKVTELVDSLERMNINMLFTIGGDGTLRGAADISREAQRRGLKLAVNGVPKTIDNDLSYVEKSFGFETAVEKAVEAVSGAHVEAHDSINGIGLVKVMGRESGFIAAHTSLAINDVNYVLIPEVPFDLDGPNGLLANLENRLKERNHSVILVAEGAGQDLLEHSKETDASGNKKLGDIGELLKDKIKSYFKKRKIPINMKYIDPSYMIRSAPANANDSLYCARLGNGAVHAAMAGKTETLISRVNGHMVYIPIGMAVSKRKRVPPESSMWRDVVDATGMPALMKN